MHFGLRAQIGLILVALNVIMVILIGLATVKLMRRAVVDVLVDRGQQLGELIAHRLEHGAESGLSRDASLESSFEALCRDFVEQRLVAQLQINEETGVVRWSCGQDGEESSLSAAQPSLTEADGEEGSGWVVREIGSALHLGRPLELDGSTRLHLQLALVHDKLFARAQNAQLLILSYVVLNAVLLFIGGYLLLTFSIVSPVRRIQLAMERLAAGDYASALHLSWKNELGAVAKSFNHMVARLDENRGELESQVEALRVAKAELEQAQDGLIRGEKLASVGRLAAGIAHEVGNPLSAMLGFVEILREDPKLDLRERVDILARLEREVLRIHETIRGLLDYSRSEGDSSSPCDLRDVISEARALVEVQPKFRHVELLQDLEPELPLVQINSDRLLQVLVNLLMNAADAISGAGTVHITGQRQADVVLLSLCDSGSGIEPQCVPMLFEPFYTTKPAGQGTGLGLAMVERIIQASGGRVEVEPRPGDGACFHLYLPLAQSAEEQDKRV